MGPPCQVVSSKSVLQRISKVKDVLVTWTGSDGLIVGRGWLDATYVEPLDSGQVLYGAPDGAGVMVVRLPDCVVVKGSSLAARLGRE